MILKRAWLAFVGVARDVARVGRLLVNKLPLHTGRETGTPTAAKPRGLHRFDDLIGWQCQRLLQPLVSLVPQIEIEREGVRFANVSGQNRFHVPLSSRLNRLPKTARSPAATAVRDARA